MFNKSRKLDNVCYDIRGPVLTEAKRLEEEGYKVLHLNTGNPAPFGFHTPDEIVRDVIINLPKAQGYSDSQDFFAARKAIMQSFQEKGIHDVDHNDIYIGNGVSELIQLSMQGLLDDGDEILIPSPDYPLWTASVNLAGGRAVHYKCDEENLWYPDLEDLESKINSRTKGLVIINPNNPTGALYPREIIEKMVALAEKNNLIVYSDEIYDKILYDGAEHFSAASINADVLFVTFNGLSKAYRAAGFRTGWMVLSGNKKIAKDYIEGLNILSNMRLCSNVPTQYAIQTALGGYQSIYELTAPGGRLAEQRDIAYRMLNDIPGISCVKPQAALYCFPKIDTGRFDILSDEQFALDLLLEKRILIVQGAGFNLATPDHFRVVFLPEKRQLEGALSAMGDFFAGYKQKPGVFQGI